MPEQLLLFDVPHDGRVFSMKKALLEKEKALKRVRSNDRNQWIERARIIAFAIAKTNGSVTADEVRKVMYAQDDMPHHYNAWGAVFSKAKGLRWSGTFKKSAVVKGHGNLQRVWVLECKETEPLT